MRISDWSSDVCSSDLPDRIGAAAKTVKDGALRHNLLIAAQRRRRNGPRVTRGLDLIKRHRTALIPRMVDENRQRPRFVFSFPRNEVRPHHRQVENDCTPALSKISNGIRYHCPGGSWHRSWPGKRPDPHPNDSEAGRERVSQT